MLGSPLQRAGAVVGEEPGRPFLAHVAREQARVGCAQIDHDEPVERVAELTIGVESQQPAAELQVVLEQYRHAFVVGLDTAGVRARNGCRGFTWRARPASTLFVFR